MDACQNSNDQTVTFFGYGSPLSNFHPSKFTIDGKEYNTVEQYIQAKKAEFFKDEIALARIMKLQIPSEIKKIGKRIKNYVKEDWERAAKGIMKRGVTAKFQQNKDLKTFLINTGTRKIGESTLDTYWGTGIGLNKSDTLITDKWCGENNMGFILMDVRDLISKS